MEESNHLVADVRGWGHLQYLPNGADVQDANGRLIAAAPELLEAAQAVLSHKRGEDDWLILAVHCRALEDAIAKATGLQDADPAKAA